MTVFSIIQKSQLEGAHRLDAEYYQPEYLTLQKNIDSTDSAKLWSEIDGKFITGPFGSEFNTENYIPDGEYRYMRGKDVKDFFLTDDDNVYIPDEDYARLKKYSLSEGDILISVVGTPGIASIVDKNVVPAIFSCKSTAFRTKAIDTCYLLAYLNSKYGRTFLARSIRGALQTGLNIDDLKNLPIFVPKQHNQEIVASFVKNAKEQLDLSKSLYSQAENMLLEELGLKDFRAEEDLFSIVSLSDIKSAHRMDAEYFQSEWGKLKGKLGKTEKLGNLATLQKGFEPGSEQYQEEGKLFIRVSSISKDGITDKDQKYLSDELYKNLKKDFEPKVGEILLTKDATPGAAYAIKEPIEGIIAGGVLRLKPKGIEPEYLALCINSLVGQAQVNRDAGGSIIAHWKPAQIKNLIVPVLPETTQDKISDLVRKSHEAHKKSKELLEEAKRKVEEMIERQ